MSKPDDDNPQPPQTPPQRPFIPSLIDAPPGASRVASDDDGKNLSMLAELGSERAARRRGANSTASTTYESGRPSKGLVPALVLLAVAAGGGAWWWFEDDASRPAIESARLAHATAPEPVASVPNANAGDATVPSGSKPASGASEVATTAHIEALLNADSKKGPEARRPTTVAEALANRAPEPHGVKPAASAGHHPATADALPANGGRAAAKPTPAALAAHAREPAPPLKREASAAPTPHIASTAEPPAADGAAHDHDVAVLSAMLALEARERRGTASLDSQAQSALAQNVQQCDARGGTEARACKRRVCEGYWGKAEACPARSELRQR